MTIAIDGPVGAGKSTIAHELARELGILHLDTGAMYRAMALKALRQGICPSDEKQAATLCAQTRVEVELGDDGQRTLLDGEDVTGLIRTPEVSAAASDISTVGAVRARMVALQRECAARADMVLDGRDIGTRVLPGATFKFFLTAPAEVRARRRWLEMRQKGQACEFDEVLRAVVARDRQDTERAVDPLRRAEDAVEIDTSDKTLREVVETLLAAVRREKA